MTHLSHSPRNGLSVLLFTFLFAACGSTAPTGVETDNVQGTWSGTFSEFSLMGRSLTGDADWTFDRNTFEIIFFNPPDDQAERIEGKWKFADGKIALVLTSSFPIDTDVGATDTLFVSILRDEMSLKTIAESSIRLVKTRLAKQLLQYTRSLAAIYPVATTLNPRPGLATYVTHKASSTKQVHHFADLRLHTLLKHPPA